MTKKILTHARLKEIFHYSPETGLFTRLQKTSAKTWVGEVVGTLVKKGYLSTYIEGHHYLLHRLAWFYMMGEWPLHQIDHKFGIKTDNRWSELRAADGHKNQQNRRKPNKCSKTGLLGVFPLKNGKFLAQLSINGRSMYLGTHENPEVAHNVYLTAKRKHHEGCTI